MTKFVSWFRYQLKASAEGFEWAFAQIPRAFLGEIPTDPDYLGTWPPARHVWHVTEYERCLAFPAMYTWLDSPLPPKEDWPDDDETWAIVKARGFDELVANFRRTRGQQIDLLDRLASVDWSEPREVLWGPQAAIHGGNQNLPAYLRAWRHPAENGALVGRNIRRRDWKINTYWLLA